MKKLYNVTCSGRSVGGTRNNNTIYVVACDEKEASEKALSKMRELKYDKVDDYVSNVALIADEKDTCNGLLIV